jgi:hypothetical protein
MDEDEDAEREERAAELSNEITDAATTLVSEYEWSVEDVIAHVTAVLHDYQ